MLQETMTHVCRVCESTNIVKNGTNRCGNAQYHCKDCGTYRVLKPKPAYSETNKQTVLRAGLERCSLRGVERISQLLLDTVVLLGTWIAFSQIGHPDCCVSTLRGNVVMMYVVLLGLIHFGMGVVRRVHRRRHRRKEFASS